MKLNRRARLLRPHDDVEDGYHEWVADPFLGRHLTHRDALGRERPGAWRVWRRWVCNNPDCSAEALISDEAIERYVGKLLPARPPQEVTP